MRISFIKKISIYFVGNLSTRLLSVILVPIYAYFVSASDLGKYDYIVAMASVISPIIYLAIWEAILRYCINEEELKEKQKLLSTTLAFVGIITILNVCVFLLIYSITLDLAYIFVFGFVVLQGLTSVWQFSARALKENQVYVISSIIGSIAIIFFEVLFILGNRLDYVSLCVSNIGSQLLVVIILELKLHLLNEFRISRIHVAIIKRMLLFSVPLVINNVSLYLYNSGSKIIIQNFIGSEENGLYSFASKFSILITLFSSVVSMAVIEEAYSFKTLQEYRVKMSKLISKISVGYFFLIMITLPGIYILYHLAFINTEYFVSRNYIFLLLLGALFTALSNNFGSAFQVTDNTKYISSTTIIGAIFALGISIITLRWIGVRGVLIGGVIGPFVMMLLRFLYARKSTGLSIDLRCNAILFISAMIEYFILMQVKSLFILLGLWLCIILIIIVLNLREIKDFFKLIREGKLK